MFLALEVGRLHEPLRGRCWEPAQTGSHVAARLASYGQAGVRPGDRVFLHHGNTPEFFADLLAVWGLGACAVPIDARLTPFEVHTLAAAARPRLSIFREEPEAGGELAAALDEEGVARATSPGEAAASRPPAGPVLPHVPLDADALILFTSGTTGDPKGVVHTHRSLRARWSSLRHHLGLERFERSLCLLPTHFGHGLICNALFPWLGGCDLFVLPPFRPELVMRLGALLDEHEITFLSSVPSVWRLALELARPPTRALRRVHCGSAPLSAHTWRAIGAWAGTRDVCNAYGITETGSWLAGTAGATEEPEDGLVGEGWGSELAVLRGGDTDAGPSAEARCAPGESGLVWANTPALMRGYFGRDDLTRRVVRSGWFCTGDVGLLDERGRLYLRGREREEINKGGTKVYPGDVDAVAERFAAVRDACSFAVEDRLYGQNVGLAVVLEGGDGGLRELWAWLARRLAEYQLPARLWLVDEIPRTSRGKVNREQVGRACQAREPVDLRRALRGGG